MTIKLKPKLFAMFVVALTLMTQSCSPPSQSSATQPLPPAPGCSTTLIDAGQKGSVATTIRGSYTDTKMVPGTSSPVTAYIDASAVSIKIAYWNGSNFLTEPVAGDGTGAFVRLVILPNGTPIVFWTLGANLKAAVRSAPLGQTGAWVGGIIDTGVAPRAPEVAVNPLGQVAVAFLTDTAATGRAKFLYCNAPCTSVAGFQNMSGSPWIENTNIVAAEVAIGVGWCQANSTKYYPVAAYGVTGSTHYASCLNSTLSNCLSGANWTTSVVVATGNLSTKLLVDPNVVGDIPKVASLGASGITPYVMGSTACTSAPAAFSAGSAMGIATSGSQWMSFLKDPVGKFHLMANDSTTTVKYFNSTTTTVTGAWNAAGVVDTTTLAAASGGGADINPAGSGIYVSYGQNVLPFDIRLGRVNDYTQTSNTATFSRLTPDVSGDLQLSAAGTQLKNVAISSNAQKIPAIAYVDYSVGAVANAKLKFAMRTGSSSSSPWVSYIVPDTINPQFPSLGFDQNGLPWLGYFDAGVNRFYLTTNSMPSGSGAWSTYEFPATPSGAPVALPAANNTAVGMFYSSGVANPVLVVIDTNAASKGVKATMLNPRTGVWSATQTIDGLTTGALGAAHVAIDNDMNGNLVVAYQELNVARVRYSASSDAVTWTTPMQISAVSQGQGISIRINPATGSPAISYFDQVNNTVYYNPCTGTPTTCATGGWNPVQVEVAAGVSALTATNNQILSTALNFTSAGASYLFYPRGQANDGNLLLAQNATGAFVLQVASPGSLGNLPGSPALNFGVAGWNVVAAPNASGYFTSAFIGPGNRIYATSCGD